MAGERSVVCLPYLSWQNGMEVLGGRVSPGVRRHLLYWNKVVVPQTHVAGFGVERDLVEAFRAGVLEYHEVNPGSGPSGALLIRGAQMVFDRLEAAQPGGWDLAVPDPLTGARDAGDNRGVGLRLVESLPEFGQDFRIEDILAFRDRRKDELSNFRALIDEMHLDILREPDRPLAERVHAARLAKSVQAARAVALEADKAVRFLDLEFSASPVEFQVSPAVTVGLLMGVAAQSPETIMASLAAGVTFGGLTITPKIRRRQLRRDTPVDYVLAMSAGDELRPAREVGPSEPLIESLWRGSPDRTLPPAFQVSQDRIDSYDKMVAEARKDGQSREQVSALFGFAPSLVDHMVDRFVPTRQGSEAEWRALIAVRSELIARYGSVAAAPEDVILQSYLDAGMPEAVAHQCAKYRM